MSTAITKTKKVAPLEFPLLAGGGGVSDVIAANFGSGFQMAEQDLTSVKIPSGGSTSWSIESAAGEESVKEIVGLWVHKGYRGVLWPTEEPGANTPVMVANSMTHGHLVGDDFGDLDPAIIDGFKRDDGTYDWRALTDGPAPRHPLGFGSGKNGSKRVNEYQMLCVLRPGTILPLMVRITPGSFRALSGFLFQLVDQGVPFYRSVIGLSLVKAANKSGQAFSQVSFRLVDTIAEKDGDQVLETYVKALESALSM